MMLKVLFKGLELYATEGNLKCSPLTTEYDYTSGIVSYAMVEPDGNVYRYNKVIGTIDDIMVLGEVEDLRPKADAWVNLLFHPSWDAT